MRVVIQILLSFLLLLALPISAAPGGGSPNVDGGIRERSVSPDAIKANPRALLPYIFKGLQHLPSALDVTGGEQGGATNKSSSPDFWEMAADSEKSLEDYVQRLLEAAATYFNSTRFTDITSSMTAIVSTTATFRDDITGALEAHNFTFDMLSQELEGAFTTILDDLKNMPSPDQVPGHVERAKMADKILDDAGRELTELVTRFGIDEIVVTTFLSNLKPQVQTLIVVVGDINEQCPQLFPALAFSVAIQLIPENWILKPLLRPFGFGPAGPIKGSAAAWMQSQFWGGGVESSSWFSLLQAAGMGVMPKWLNVITKVRMLGGLLAGFYSCFNHG